MPVAKNENQLDSEESIAMNIRLLDLMKKTSYRILQINGQRRYGGPPPEWSGPPPPKDSEVFVGKIPRNCFEDELVPVFSKVGKIYELRLMMDFSGTNRGYAFVMYTSSHEAERAVNELNNFEIRPGRNIGVVRSTNNCKIYIGTLAGNVDRKHIKKTIKSLTEGVVDVKIHAVPGSRKRMNSRKPHFVIAEYESHRAAAMARRRLLPARLELWGHEVSVEWANTFQKVSLQKPCGNRRRTFRDELQTSRAPSGFCPIDSKLINGRTLEQAMDDMLYGSGEHSPTHSLESTDTNSSLTSESLLSDSDNSFNCPMSGYFFDLEMGDSLVYSSAVDDTYSDITIEEFSQYKNVDFLPKSDVLNKNRYNSDIKLYPKEFLLENSLIQNFSQMSVCDQYQLFDNENEYNKEIVNSKNNRRFLDGSHCYLCSVNCPVIGLTPRRQSLSFRSNSDLIYPLVRYTTDNKKIDIKNI